MEAVNELLGGVGGGLVDEDRAVELAERFLVGVGFDERRAVAEVVVGVAESRENQVQFLAVVTAAAE